MQLSIIPHLDICKYSCTAAGLIKVLHSGHNKEDTLNDVNFCTFKSPIKKNNPIFFTQICFY